MKNCPKCGFENKDTANYCDHCGYNFAGVSSTETPYTPTPLAQEKDPCYEPLSGRDVCAILGFFTTFVGGSLISLVLLVIGLKAPKEHRLAIAGIVLNGILGIYLLIVFLVFNTAGGL